MTDKRWEALVKKYSLHDLVVNSIDGIYDGKLRNNGLVGAVRELADSDFVSFAFKKAALKEMYEAAGTEKPFKALYPDNIFRKARAILILSALPLLVLSGLRKIGRYGKKKYRVGLRIYNGDFALTRKYRSMDFLIDNRILKSKEAIFCAETRLNKEYEEALKERGYAYVIIPDILRTASPEYLKNIFLKKFLKAWAKSVIYSFSSPYFIVHSGAAFMRDYLLWERFREEYDIKHYVSFNNYEAGHVIRNIVLKKDGVTTWHYLHSSHSIDLFTPPGEKSLKHYFFSHYYYDKLAGWGSASAGYYASFPNAIAGYANFGCLWSEHVRLASQDRAAMSELKKKVSERIGFVPKKIISVFDTTFGGVAPLDFKDASLFIEGIVRLLDDLPDAAVIFKEKWTSGDLALRHPEIVPTYEKLYKHKRCYTTGDENRDGTEVMALSDIVISACFTSPTNETLGALRRAIFFDPTCVLRGFYYDKFPKLVAHGYEELVSLVRYWLYEATDETFKSYVHENIKGEIDSYADGMAVTRFREALTEGQ